MQVESYYDVFISFKDSDDKGNDTEDKKVAYELYTYLIKKKLTVFFSAETFIQHGTDQWRNEIEHAIQVSKIFIAVGSQKTYMQSKWLQLERTSFLALRSIDNTRAIYSYLITPMTIKDLPDDIKEVSSFSPNNRDKLYQYISQHLRAIKLKKQPILLKRNSDRSIPIQNSIDTISSRIIPFSLILFSLSIFSKLQYPYLELDSVIYAYIVISLIILKVYILIKEKFK
ncbi:MAG: Unknown protein [uncultured Sulfurovum sp.]|uniref:TIR domain-containing protein n=1 Tax=uncultured Sulfurovum sp. TaxID=269237 RepID=A0A6S6U8N4_9BACT|nr:MAG: Unknown protein [uncultured Sulfurovum sp.]